MSLQEKYNKWQMIEVDSSGNNELYQFTRSELLDFAKYANKNNLDRKIIAWAKAKGITNPNNVFKQALKLTSEVGELSDAIIKQDLPETVDAIGDIQVVLIILCNQLGLDMNDCLESAYNVIKDRTGVTKNGVFIKKEDL